MDTLAREVPKHGTSADPHRRSNLLSGEPLTPEREQHDPTFFHPWESRDLILGLRVWSIAVVEFRVLSLALGVSALTGAVSACIVPDKGIDFCDEVGAGATFTGDGAFVFIPGAGEVDLFPSVDTCLNAQDFDYLTSKQADCIAAGSPEATGDLVYVIRLAELREDLIETCLADVQAAGGLIQNSNCFEPAISDVCPALDAERESCGNCDSDANDTTLGETGGGSGSGTSETSGGSGAGPDDFE